MARNVRVARILLAVAVLATLGFVVETAFAAAPPVQKIAYAVCGAFLAYGAIAHLLSHLGYVLRLRDEAEVHAEDGAGSIPVGFLIPSYREEPGHVLRALLSCALQRHEEKWIRLLIDDPSPAPSDADARQLETARALPARVHAFVEPFARDVRAALPHRGRGEALRAVHDRLATRFAAEAARWPRSCHHDRLFAERVLGALAAAHAARAEELARAPASPAAAAAEFDRLARRFEVDVATFERKRYLNLSHVKNKAMNLNSFIALLGRRFTEVATSAGLFLRPSPAGPIAVPDADYLVTLDADSMLLPAYAGRLVSLLERPEHARTAVAQTPYAAVPEAPGALERLAGATTDVQRLLHQGYTRFDATFWVGANAVLRRRALDDIRETEVERGHPVVRFIQDRTVIEDTESTIDFALQGWHLHNHPEVLAYSATPADFGALAVQRGRWACGGLLVLGKAVRAGRRGGCGVVNRSARTAIRLHYLGSLAWVPAALIALAFLPFDAALAGIFLPLVALPYFVGYALDLRLAGRPVSDLVKIYALNLVLIPVNLTGAILSLRQAVTGAKVPFVRTPKIDDRTAAPPAILLALWGGALLLIAAAVSDLVLGKVVHAAFAGVNGVILLAGTVAFVGLRHSLDDLRASWGRPSAARTPRRPQGGTAALGSEAAPAAPTAVRPRARQDETRQAA